MSDYPDRRPVQNVVVRSAKETWLAYLLWFLLGTFGVHKFYLRRNRMGFLYLALGLIGGATAWFLVGFIFLVPLWVMMVIDLFTMPGRVRSVNARMLGGHTF